MFCVQGIDSRVRVHNLRIASEFGGILDPDDSLLAVVEDKEQVETLRTFFTYNFLDVEIFDL